MADKRALGMIGLMLGAATVFVTVISAVVVGITSASWMGATACR